MPRQLLHSDRPWAVRYGVSAAVWVAALVATLTLAAYVQRANFVVFWIAVLFAAWYGGLGPALLAALASVLTVNYVFVAPRHQWGLRSGTDLLTLGIFVVASMTVASLTAALGRAERRAQRRAQQLALLARQLEEHASDLERQTEQAQELAQELEHSNELLEETAVEAEETRHAVETERTRLQSVLDGLPDVTFGYDAQWRFNYMNPSARSYLRAIGHDPDALVGRCVWDVSPAIAGAAFRAETLRAVAEQRVVELEEWLDRPAGWYEHRVIPSAGGALTFSRDVTARKRAEQGERLLAETGALLAAESLDYRATLQRVAELAVPALADWCVVEVVDEETGVLEQVAVAHVDPARVEWARELRRRYPPPPDASTGAPAVVRTGRAELYPHVTDEMLALGAVDEEHLRLLRQIGMHALIIAPLTARGRTIGALGTVRAESRRRYEEADLALVTELARRAATAIDNARLFAAEQRARRAAEREQAAAEAANRAKSDFLATMSHELRTPLNAIGGYAELLEMGIHGPVTEAQRDALGRLRRSQRVLLSLVNDVLNLARIEAGTVDYAIESVPLDAALDEVEAMVAPQVAAKGLHYSYDDRCAPGVRVRADRDKLRQIVLNLLSNAIKFTDSGGAVRLACDASDAAVVRVRVRDTGRGIPETHFESIFEPFVQVDASYTRTSDGTGLGLAISRDLARAMGAELVVEHSALGEGSTFVLTMQRA